MAAPDTGSLASASRLALAPENLREGQPAPTTPSTTSTVAPAVAARLAPPPEGSGVNQPGHSSASPSTSTTASKSSAASAGTSQLAAPERVYGKQPASGSTSTTLSTAASGCQGTTPLGLPGTWNCTFDDEFNGTTLNTNNWLPQDTAASGYVNGATACYVNGPDTISVSGGDLNLTARQVAPFTCQDGSNTFTTSYEAGMVSTSGLFDQTYGAYEVSAKLPPSVVQGLQETFWLYPQALTYGPWPASGEIDFAEFYSQFPGLDVPYIHYAQSSTDLNATAYDCVINQNAFNTYGVDWTPTSITVLYNGRPCLVDTPTTGSEPFNQPFFIALTQALGVGTNAFTPGVTELPATTQVDWVRAWQPAS
ncbi:MAG TPA: glycoside hydrolase family 16 protein [Acidimicrobiales bacterium]|nr:glycoside hydrolase family 16 protein [Acidimicrobiales bacterium]